MTTTIRPIGTEFEVIIGEDAQQVIVQVWRVIDQTLVDGKMLEVAVPSRISYRPKHSFSPVSTTLGGQEKK